MEPDTKWVTDITEIPTQERVTPSPSASASFERATTQQTLFDSTVRLT